MAVEDRTGTCATCDGRIYRAPNLLPDVPDKWFHREKADWLTNPHEPTPKGDSDNANPDSTDNG